MSILAMHAGKDIYTEKPSCMTVAEGQAVVATAKRYGRIYQTGTQRLSEPNFVYIIEAAKQGKLGKVHTAYAHIAPWDAAEMSHAWMPAEPEPAKDVVDWNAWLGPCPWRPYNSSYVKGAWRGHYDFHTSCIGEWGAHTFAQAQAGLDTLATSPVEYEYVNNTSGDGMVTTFADGKKMVLSRGDKHWHGSCGMRFDGPEGWLSCADGYKTPEASSPSLLADFDKVIAEYKERTKRSLDHMRNFLDCVKSREQTVANPTVMHRSMSTVHAANICMWLKRNMQYRPGQGRVRQRPRGQPPAVAGPARAVHLLIDGGASAPLAGSYSVIPNTFNRKEIPHHDPSWQEYRPGRRAAFRRWRCGARRGREAFGQGAGGQAARGPEVGRGPEGEGGRLPRARRVRRQGLGGPPGGAAGRREALAHGPLRAGAEPRPGRGRGSARRARQGQGRPAGRRHRQSRRATRRQGRPGAGPAPEERGSRRAPGRRAALGKIGTPAAAKGLKDALPQAPECCRVAFCEGLLRCAEAMAAKGQKQDATEVYNCVCQSKAPQYVRDGAECAAKKLAQ